MPTLAAGAGAAALTALSGGTAAPLVGTAVATAIPTATAIPSGFQEALDSGRSPEEARRFAKVNSIIEGGVTTAFSAIPGAGGLESAVSTPVKNTIKQGIAQALKGWAKQTGGELVEENVIEIAQAVNSKMAGVDPEALSPESLTETVTLTTLQTVATMGLVGVGRSAAGRFVDTIQ